MSRDTDAPLMPTATKIWRFLVLMGSVAVTVIATRSEVLSIATEAAERRAIPILADIEKLKQQSQMDQESLKAMKRNVYLLCLANRIKDCEP